MTATPPTSSGDNPPTGTGPDFEAASYGQYSAASGPSASAPLGPPDPTTYGQPAPGYGPAQPTPTSYGTPAQGPYAGNPGYADQYSNQGQPNPYPGTQGYADPYGGDQGYPDPNAAQYAATQDYANPDYAQSQGYAQPGPTGQGYPQPGPYPAYSMAPMAMGAPLPTGMAVAAMVCGICGVVLSLCGWSIPLSIVGIVLGAFGVQKANRGQAGGRSMAITGIVTGAVGAAISGVFILIFIFAALATG